MPRTSSPRGLDELLDKQLSVATRRQLLTLGLTDRAVQYRARLDGPWQVLLPGIYLGVNGPPSMKQKEMAALLYGGPGSVITGPTALMHYSIRSQAPFDAIDVLIPAERQRRDAGFVRLQRTARMPLKIAWAGPVRLVLAPRAVADAARRLTSLRDVRAVVADAVQVGRCTIGQLAAELNEGPVRGSAMFRSVLAEVAEGIRSTAEGDLRDLIRVNELPMPMFNPSLYEGKAFLGKPDAWWPDAGVTAEVDSREWHLSPEDWDRTRRRHDVMAAAGIIPLHFSPNQIRREPAEVVRMIKHALEHGLNRPPLAIRTVPCPESSASTTGATTGQARGTTGSRARGASGSHARGATDSA
jgi:hypothetical protein